MNRNKTPTSNSGANIRTHNLLVTTAGEAVLSLFQFQAHIKIKVARTQVCYKERLNCAVSALLSRLGTLSDSRKRTNLA